MSLSLLLAVSIGLCHIVAPYRRSGNIVLVYRVSQEECARLRESVPYVKVYWYNPKHLYPKLRGYRVNGQRSLKLWQLLTPTDYQTH